MKKLSTTALCLWALAVIPTTVFAAPDTVTNAAPTINENTTGLPGITFNPSPNVELSVTSEATGYAVTSANILTNETNGMEYAAHHEATGYAQRPKTTAAQEGPKATTDIGLAGIPGTDWTWMGGGGGTT